VETRADLAAAQSIFVRVSAIKLRNGIGEDHNVYQIKVAYGYPNDTNFTFTLQISNETFEHAIYGSSRVCDLPFDNNCEVLVASTEHGSGDKTFNSIKQHFCDIQPVISINGNGGVIARVFKGRICPSCGTAVRHELDGCRHVRCINTTCQFKFCFSCLGGCTCCNVGKRFPKVCAHNSDRCTNAFFSRQTTNNNGFYSVS